MPNFLCFQCLSVHFNSQPKFSPIAIYFYIFLDIKEREKKLPTKK